MLYLTLSYTDRKRSRYSRKQFITFKKVLKLGVDRAYQS